MYRLTKIVFVFTNENPNRIFFFVFGAGEQTSEKIRRNSLLVSVASTRRAAADSSSNRRIYRNRIKLRFACSWKMTSREGKMKTEDYISEAQNDSDQLLVVADSVKEKPTKVANHGSRRDADAAKRTELSLTKPSYTLTLAPENVRHLNRRRLHHLLFKLIKGRKWEDASEVLSILMRRTCKGRSLLDNRLKYWAAMELFRHKEGDNVFSNNISRRFDSWRNNAGREKEDLHVDLEFIVYCVTHRNLEKAKEGATLLKDDAKHCNNPLSNLVFGLTFFEVWYSKLPDDLKLSGYDVYYMSKEAETSSVELHEQVQNSKQDDSVSVMEFQSHTHCDSETSVRNNEHLSEDSKKNFKKRKRLGLPSRVSPSNTSEKEEEEEAWILDDGPILEPSVFSAHGLKPSLLPLKLPDPEHLDEFVDYYGEFLRDADYKSAKKCLNLCVNSSDPSVAEAALVPLIQLCLLGGQLDKALKVLRPYCDEAKSAQSFRIKAHLLECFCCGPNAETNAEVIACYESVLKICQYTCEHSVERLVRLNQIGYWTYWVTTWILRMQMPTSGKNSLRILSEEDRLSFNEGQSKHEHGNNIKTSSQILARFTKVRNWTVRYRYWLKRHFSKDMLAAEIHSGELDLMASKAACASHFYGPEFTYVVQVRGALREKGDNSTLAFLQMHIANSVVLCPNPFQGRR
ncbi:hypothetical protein AKJ16_DCAP15655 [Drosera capensis]